MKFLLGLVAVVLCTALGFWIWVSSDPTTELVDAEGRSLTAGGAPPEDHEASPLDEVRALLDGREFADAKEKLLDLLETSDRDGETCILLSETTLALEEFDEAVDYGLKATELLPDSAPAHLAYAQALGGRIASNMKSVAGLFGMVKQLRLVKQEMLRVIECDPDDTEARTMLAMYYMAPKPIGDMDKAVEVSREIIERDPVLGNRMLAITFGARGEIERAIELCRSCFTEFPEEEDRFHFTLAGIYEREERFDEAITEYEAACLGEKDQDYYRALYDLARLDIEREIDLELAIDRLDEYIAADPWGEMMPTAAHAIWRKGNALEQLGRIEEARAAYEESLRRKPGFEKAEKDLAKLGP